MARELLSKVTPVPARYPIIVIAVVMVLAFVSTTALIVYAATSDRGMDTQITDYLPEEPLVQDYKTVESVFGPSGTYHNVMVSNRADNHRGTLGAGQLREMNRIESAAMGVEGVSQTVSFAKLVNIICLSRWKESVEDLEDYRVDGAVNSTCNMLGPDFTDLWFKNWMDNVTHPEYMAIASALTLEDFRAAATLLLSQDLDPDARSASHALIIVMLDPTLSISEQKEVSIKVKEAVKDVQLEHVKVHQTGLRLITSDVDQAAYSSMGILAGTIAIVVTIILFLGLRSFTAVLSATSTLVLVLVMTIAICALLGFKFTMLDIAVVPLIIGLGIDYTVHLSRRRKEQKLEGKDAQSSTRSAIILMGRPMSVAVATTSFALLSNALSDIGPVVEFGITCAIGIVLAFLLSAIYMMSVQSLVDGLVERFKAPKEQPPEPEPRRVGRRRPEPVEETPKEENFRDKVDKVGPFVFGRFGRGIATIPPAAILLVLLLTLGGSFLAVQVESDFDMNEFLPADWESVETYEDLNSNFNGSGLFQTYVFIRSDDDLLQPGFIHALASFEEELDCTSTCVRSGDDARTVSLLTVLRTAFNIDPDLADQYRFDAATGLPGLGCSGNDVRGLVAHLWDDDTQADLLTKMTLGQMMGSIVELDEDGGVYRALVRVYVEVSDTGSTRKMQDEVNDAVEASDLELMDAGITVTGHAIVTLTTMDVLIQAMLLSAMFSLFVALLVLLAATRNLTVSLVSVGSVAIAVVWILATMKLLDIPISVLTVMVASLTIGLGIDYSVYVAERYREERVGIWARVRPKPAQTGGGKKKGEPQEAPMAPWKKAWSDGREAAGEALGSTGTAIGVSALTTIAGFAVLVLSPIPVIRTFGLISALTISYTFVLALLFVPSVLVCRDVVGGLFVRKEPEPEPVPQKRFR